MRAFKALIYLSIVLILASFANAAAIYGTIYDLSLKKVNNARIDINTNPKQFLIAQNGTYSFNAPNGFYTINAQLMQKNDVIASVQENITIAQDGSYVLDLILFPDLEEGVEDPEVEVNGNVVGETNANDGVLLIGFIVLFLSGIIVGIFYFLKTRKKDNVSKDKENSKADEKSEDECLEQVLKIIRQENGRTTQKEIRKKIPLSEAKISLMIAELEHKGVIEKIKKGRGNIIILKKK